MTKATFGAGCFWHVEAAFRQIPGVIGTRVGYAGGTIEHPTYRAMGDHTECFQVDFDPEVVTYEDLLELFWQSHDPFAPAYKTQYASLVLASDEEQLAVARASAETIVHTTAMIRPQLPGMRPDGMGRFGSLMASTWRSNQSLTAWLVPHTSGPASRMPASTSAQRSLIG